MLAIYLGTNATYLTYESNVLELLPPYLKHLSRPLPFVYFPCSPPLFTLPQGVARFKPCASCGVSWNIRCFGFGFPIHLVDTHVFACGLKREKKYTKSNITTLLICEQGVSRRIGKVPGNFSTTPTRSSSGAGQAGSGLIWYRGLLVSLVRTARDFVSQFYVVELEYLCCSSGSTSNALLT